MDRGNRVWWRHSNRYCYLLCLLPRKSRAGWVPLLGVLDGFPGRGNCRLLGLYSRLDAGSD